MQRRAYPKRAASHFNFLTSQSAWFAIKASCKAIPFASRKPTVAVNWQRRQAVTSNEVYALLRRRRCIEAYLLSNIDPQSALYCGASFGNVCRLCAGVRLATSRESPGAIFCLGTRASGRVAIEQLTTLTFQLRTSGQREPRTCMVLSCEARQGVPCSVTVHAVSKDKVIRIAIEGRLLVSQSNHICLVDLSCR